MDPTLSRLAAKYRTYANRSTHLMCPHSGNWCYLHKRLCIWLCSQLSNQNLTTQATEKNTQYSKSTPLKVFKGQVEHFAAIICHWIYKNKHLSSKTAWRYLDHNVWSLWTHTKNSSVGRCIAHCTCSKLVRSVELVLHVIFCSNKERYSLTALVMSVQSP